MHLPRVNTPYGSKSIKFKACQLWNTIPEELKSINKLNTLFKKHVKRQHFVCHTFFVVLFYFFLLGGQLVGR